MQEKNTMTQILRNFVSISEGQVHYRSVIKLETVQRQSPKPLWMIHASPSSALGLTGLIAEFGCTRTVYAPDTLGNGDSAPAAPIVPDITYYANSSLRVMDALGLDKVDLYGTHTGAHIVAEMAIARPDRFGRVILDGIAMFSPEDKADLLANYAPEIELDVFGTQFHWAWNFVRDQGWFFPYFRKDAVHLRGIDAPSKENLHRTTVEVLKSISTYHHAYRAAFTHADRERLPMINIPTLVMCDDTDPLKPGVPEAAALISGSQQIIFKNASAPNAIKRKADLIMEFLDAG